jgi:hypothetical protein
MRDARLELLVEDELVAVLGRRTGDQALDDGLPVFSDAGSVGVEAVLGLGEGVAVGDERLEVDGAASDEVKGELVGSGTVTERALHRELLVEERLHREVDVGLAVSDLSDGKNE